MVEIDDLSDFSSIIPKNMPKGIINYLQMLLKWYFIPCKQKDYNKL